MASPNNFLIGIDVGTASTRAGLFDPAGRLLAAAASGHEIFRPRPDFVEQSSDDIWEKAGDCVREVLRASGVAPEAVAGLGFDATCSLVCLDAADRPLSVSGDGDARRNIIVWMDHRAVDQAERINRGGHRVLDYVGGRISPEMQPPKLLWLKENLPGTWAKAGRFLDLADFLVYRATGQDRRSLCTSVCKWTYLGHQGPEGAWDLEFFRAIGLADLFGNGRVPATAHPLGSLAGALSAKSAAELGLTTGTMVGVGIIDAHAGGLGSLGPVAASARTDPAAWDRALALVGGTSSCHMVSSYTPRFVPGVWGPYRAAMIPGMWLNEGGQSASGALLDQVIEDSAAGAKLAEEATKKGESVYQALNRIVHELQAAAGCGPELTIGLHVLPYHHGNRSPRADPGARGTVSGLTLESGAETLALRYYATVQAIAYGTRHIIEALGEQGYRTADIHLCGGHVNNPLLVQEYADVTGCQVALPREKEAVLLGAAILGATAAGIHPGLLAAMEAMSHAGEMVRPDSRHAAYHQRKYEVFTRMYGQQKELAAIMAGGGEAESRPC